MQSVERQPFTDLISHALKDSGVFMAHTRRGIIRDWKEHDLIFFFFFVQSGLQHRRLLEIQNVDTDVCLRWSTWQHHCALRAQFHCPTWRAQVGFRVQRSSPISMIDHLPLCWTSTDYWSTALTGVDPSICFQAYNDSQNNCNTWWVFFVCVCVFLAFLITAFRNNFNSAKWQRKEIIVSVVDFVFSAVIYLSWLFIFKELNLCI